MHEGANAHKIISSIKSHESNPMNKYPFIIVGAAIAGLVLCGCNKAGKLSEQSKEQAAPSGPVQLTQKWADGESIVKHIDMKMNMEINVPNQPAPVKQDVTLGEKYSLSISKPDGSTKVEMEFLSLRMNSAQGGNTNFSYDSEVKSEPPRDRGVAAIMKGLQSMIGAKIDFYLNATNGIDKIEGVDALMSRMNSGGAAMNQSGIKNMFNKGNLQQMLGDSEYLPPHPVAPGDKWPVVAEVDLGEMGTLTVSNSVTFAQWEKHGPRLCARLEFEGTFAGKPNENVGAQGMSMSIQNGTTSGVSWFDQELGIVIDSDADQDLNMQLKVPVRANGKASVQSITMAMHQILNVKLDSVK